MSESTDAAAGGRRGGRTVSKSTPDEVMELACGLPLTRSVLRSVVAGATPGQLGVLADLFRAENASRTESRRARLIRNAGFPCVKGFDGYDWGMASFPADWGREQLMDLGFVDRAEDLVLYGDVGCGKTHMAIATGMLACERGMPVRFFTASSLVMRLRRARDENRLDAELRAIGRARLLVIDELGYLPIDIDGARLLFQVVADSYEKRSVVFTTNLEFGRWGEVFGDGDMAAAVIDRIVHHGRIVRFRGESYRNSHSLSVLRSVVAGATPGQLGVLADLFRAENASRTESRRARLIRNAGFPCVKGFDGYDWGMASFPADWGREQLMDLGFVDRAEDLVLYGDVGCGKTHMAIATGMLACERGMPVRFFTASSLVMRLRRARDENRLDAELRAIGRARLLVIDELGYLPIDIDGARLLFQVVADSYEKRSVVFTTNLEFGRWGEVFGDGDMAAAVIDRIVHHGRIVRFRGESYRNSHSLMK